MSTKLKARIGLISFYDEGYSPDLIDRRLKLNIDQLKECNFVEIVFEHKVKSFLASKEIAERIRSKYIDCIIILVASWTETRLIVECLQHFMHKPILIWTITGVVKDNVLNSPAPIGGAAPVVFYLKSFPDTNFVFIRDTHEKGIAIEEAIKFIKSSGCIADLKDKTIGITSIGTCHTFTFNFDATSLKSKFGIGIEDMSITEITDLMDGYAEKDIKDERDLFIKNFEFFSDQDINDKTVIKTIKLFKALKEKISRDRLDALMLNCFLFGDTMDLTLCLPFSLLSMDVPCKGGVDVMSAVTQFIVRYLSNKVTAYLEVFEQLNKTKVLMSSCGYAPKSMCEGKKIICDSGRWGDSNLPGIKNCSLMKEGLMTMARISFTGDSYLMHAAIGNAKKPLQFKELDMLWKNVKEMPCTPSVEFEFINSNADEFLDNIISSHYTFVYGDYLDELKMYCRLNKIDLIVN